MVENILCKNETITSDGIYNLIINTSVEYSLIEKVLIHNKDTSSVNVIFEVYDDSTSTVEFSFPIESINSSTLFSFSSISKMIVDSGKILRINVSGITDNGIQVSLSGVKFIDN